MTAIFKNISILLFVFVFFSPTVFAVDELEVPNLRHPIENVSTGGQPSIDDIKKLKSLGYTTVVNLRGPGEFDDFVEKDIVEGEGLNYINIPFNGMRGLTRENATLLNEALDNAQGKVLLHCTIGMRAGGLLAVQEYLFGDLSKEEALELATKAHMSHLEEYVENAIENIEKN